MSYSIRPGSTDQTVYISVPDSSSTTGGKLTGLVFDAASLTAYYTRTGAAATAITLATQTVTGAHSDGGFVEVSSSNAPGLYRLDLPDAAVGTGAAECIVSLKGAANMAQVDMRINLRGADVTAWNGTLVATPDTAGFPEVNIKAAGIDAAAFDAGAITSTAIDNGAIGASEIATGALTAAKFASDAIALTNVEDALIDEIADRMVATTDFGTMQAGVSNIEAATQNIQSRLPASLVSGKIDANIGAISDDAIAADNAEAFFDGTGYAGTNNVIPTVTSVGTVTTLSGHTAQTGDSYAIVNSGTHGNAALKTLIDVIDGVVDLILEDTGTTVPAQISGLNNLSAAQVNAECDTALSEAGVTTTVMGRIDAAVSTRATPAQILTTALTESYATSGSAPTLVQAIMLIQQSLHEFAISGTTRTVKKLDGSTAAATFTLDDATNPTSTTRAT